MAYKWLGSSPSLLCWSQVPNDHLKTSFNIHIFRCAMITSIGSGLHDEEAGVVTVSLLVTEVSLLCWEAPIPDSRSGGVSGGKGAGG